MIKLAQSKQTCRLSEETALFLKKQFVSRPIAMHFVDSDTKCDIFATKNNQQIEKGRNTDSCLFIASF